MAIDLPIDDLQSAFNNLIDWFMSSGEDQVIDYVSQLRSKKPTLSNKELAKSIVDKQARNSAALGALTGFGGLVTLPATIPFDLVKSWKIQVYTIHCIAYLYRSGTDNDKRKTDTILIMSNGSLDELQNSVLQELRNAPNHALRALNQVKQPAVNLIAEQGVKQAAKLAVKCGGKATVEYTMKGASKHLVKLLWKVGGRKIAEKAAQKAFSKAIPVVGAVVGGGMDWGITQAVGKLAIEYYEKSYDIWVESMLRKGDRAD